jgi:hypothetical protein
VSQELTPIIIQSVWKRFLNPKRVCGELGMCRKFYRKLDLQQEIHRIIDTKPKENKKALPATTNSTFKYCTYNPESCKYQISTWTCNTVRATATHATT